MPTKNLRLVHFEDDPLWREFVSKSLSGYAPACRLQTASSACAGSSLLCGESTDIVLLGLPLFEGQWHMAIGVVSSEKRRRPIVFIAPRCDASILYNIDRLGVCGFVWKDTALCTSIRDAVAAVSSGRRYLPSSVQAALDSARRDPNYFGKILSRREIALLPLFGRGDADDEIAAYTGLKVLTVRSHCDRIMQKLGIHRRTKLMQWCAEKGFTQPTAFQASFSMPKSA